MKKLLITTLAAICPSAHAQLRAPNDVELRAGYCLGLLTSRRNEVASYLTQMPASVDARIRQSFEKSQSERDDEARRLGGYLLIKSSEVDLRGTTIALTHGESDWRKHGRML
jgi:hypothetical protein